MPYIPNSEEDQKKMLDSVGVSSISDLFKIIPENLRLKELLDVPPALSEPELMRHLEEMAAKNRLSKISFTGGGIYNHYVPPVISSIVMRPEFATAYTPYQAEVAQGTLQVIYEFQTHICRLTGMDVANASMYDGATSMTEAAILASGYTKRNKIVISDTVNPHYREVMRSTISGLDLEIIILPSKNGQTDFNELEKMIDDSCACLILGQPNYFGYLEDLERGEKAIHDAGGLFITVADPISLGILKTPAEYNADIFVGEGQGLGLSQNFGGPLLGLFACKKKFIRKIPGRLAARTTDVDGKPGFVLTLQTREQHIRRDKATSNICTNEALCATAATIFMSMMGRQGIPRIARLSTERAHYLADKINDIKGYSVWNNSPFFKEFVVETPVPANEVIQGAAEVGVAAGIDLGRYYPGYENRLLIAVTEVNTFTDCDKFVAFLSAQKTR
ncbi:MAG: aminomethyl-transferring glycine dehydrogenase subunit GcvPA [candidate division Zixibacteria bacterium]|nr:aminomethyl-transferring glycine dehydrogenase subunit GcvPA [candidate division Zixibacteria bacterium]